MSSRYFHEVSAGTSDVEQAARLQLRRHAAYSVLEMGQLHLARLYVVPIQSRLVFRVGVLHHAHSLRRWVLENQRTTRAYVVLGGFLCAVVPQLLPTANLACNRCGCGGLWSHVAFSAFC